MYQYHHILGNIQKLKSMYDAEKKAKKQQQLIDFVKNAKPREMPTSFNDAICPQPKQEKTESTEEISPESLGLSPADLDALIECGQVFS